MDTILVSILDASELLQATAQPYVEALETQRYDAGAVGQFLVSSKTEVSPAEIVRSVKGRLQYLVRDVVPQLWRRHYSITSVGPLTE